MADDIAEAAAFFVRVCEEHGRVFPLRNILVATDGYRASEDKERFVEDVSAYLLADVRRRLEDATKQIAAEHRFGGPNIVASEIEIMAEATELVAAARATDRDPDDDINEQKEMRSRDGRKAD
ncbi:hypothetical protein ACQQ2Q_04750 [Agrobacterium sp. ES01]|uniref:hypothetical protein n=1 Tax=Agrobacterium sp. ES01 TaxID=3420714 RepID=UPI003D0CF241